MRITKLIKNEYAYILKCIRQNEPPIIKTSSRQGKITDAVKYWIENHKETEEFRNSTIKEHIELISKDLDLAPNWIHCSCLQRYYKKYANLSFKMVNRTKPDMDNEESKRQRREFVLEMIPAILAGYQPIFIDETGIKLDT